MIRALSKEDLRQLIQELAGYSAEEATWLSRAQDWEVELIGFDYLFAQLLEASQNASEELPLYLGVASNDWFKRESFSIDFIRFLLGHIRDDRLSLEEQLVYLCEKLNNHEYGQSLRF